MPPELRSDNGLCYKDKVNVKVKIYLKSEIITAMRKLSLKKKKKYIMITRPCNIQQYFTTVKSIIFR